MTTRQVLLTGIAVVATIGAAAYTYRGPIGLALMERTAARNFAADPIKELPDGLHVAVCGAGSPLPDEKRSAPCTVVIAGKRMFVFDAGGSAARGIGRMQFNQGRIEAVFLTHFHSDHIDGLGELMTLRWVSTANDQPLPVYGPKGVETVVAGFNDAYAQDQSYRTAHHGEKIAPPSGAGAVARPFATAAGGGRAVMVSEPDLEIVAFDVDHGPIHPAVGYRIRYKDRTVVLSGDTSKSPAVQREAQGVDLLVHEALSPAMVSMLGKMAHEAGRDNISQIMVDIQNYHTSPEQAAETARDAKVGYLLLNHIVPPLPLKMLEGPFLGKARDIFGGDLRVATDGDLVSLPAGSKDIRTTRRP
jgi:ribonuclease Z